MAPLRYRDDDESSGSWMFIAAGAVVGLAAGLVVAQRFGGLSGVTSRLRERAGRRGEGTSDDGAEARRRAVAADHYEDDYDDEVPDEELEERVLEAFTNDPILGERPIDIGAVGAATIELSGWVYAPDESEHAATVAGGVPGVESVVNRLEVRAEEEVLEENRRRFDEGDDALRGARWEGQGVGTGRRRQGNSSEPDRHADPRVNLEDRWQSKEQAIRAAADDIENLVGEPVRNPPVRGLPKGDRTGGSPVAPSGVPKGDHVADPTAIPPDSLRAD
jgi:hypothetical protein